MTAAFPWYDLPSVRWANDILWKATGLGGELDRDTPPDAQWRSEDLVVSQACGLDLFLADAPIEPVLAPVFELDCGEGRYYSYLVGSRAGVAAVNARSSRSGWSALLTLCRPSSVLLTGSHAASLSALRAGSADLACIDAVTWHILKRDTPASVAGVPVIERSGVAPAPPFVVRKAGPRDVVARRIAAAMRAPETRLARRALLLRDVVPVTFEDYAPVLAEYRAVAPRIAALCAEGRISDANQPQLA